MFDLLKTIFLFGFYLTFDTPLWFALLTHVTSSDVFNIKFVIESLWFLSMFFISFLIHSFVFTKQVGSIIVSILHILSSICVSIISTFFMPHSMVMAFMIIMVMVSVIVIFTFVFILFFKVFFLEILWVVDIQCEGIVWIVLWFLTFVFLTIVLCWIWIFFQALWCVISGHSAILRLIITIVLLDIQVVLLW